MIDDDGFFVVPPQHVLDAAIKDRLESTRFRVSGPELFYLDAAIKSLEV
jgi:hypothetical protein